MAKVTIIKNNNKIKKVNKFRYFMRKHYSKLITLICLCETTYILWTLYGKI